MLHVTYAEVREIRRVMGAPWFTQAWDLNLVVIRSGKVGEWDDWIVVACTDDTGAEVVRSYQATGDAWDGEWIAPTHPDGCIYVLDQHVPGGLKIGYHKNDKNRPGLIQAKPFLNVRWPPGRGYVPSVDELEKLAGMGQAFSDNRGTNIHNRHSDWTPSKPSTDDSEGCTVTRYQMDHASLMKMAYTQQSRRGTVTISPTYVRRTALRDARRRLLA